MYHSINNHVAQNIYKFLVNEHCFNLETLLLLEWDNLKQLAADYGFRK